MKFYFCETCGKRITEKDVESGHGKDKKLKGVYCAQCSIGVMTMEMMPVSEADARKILGKPATPPAGAQAASDGATGKTKRATTGLQIAPVQKSNDGTSAQARAAHTPSRPHERPGYNGVLIGAGTGLLLAVLLGALLFGGEKPKPSSQNVPESARPAPVKAAVEAGKPVTQSAGETKQDTLKPLEPTPGATTLNPTRQGGPDAPARSNDPQVAPAESPEAKPATPVPAEPQKLPAEVLPAPADAPTAPNAEAQTSAGEVKAAYRRFQLEFFAAMQKSRAEAATLLDRNERDATLKSMSEHLRQDRMFLAWLDVVEKASRNGMEKLRDLDDFELRFSSRAPIHVGTKAPFRVASIKDGKMELTGQGVGMEVSCDTFDRETALRLAQLTLKDDESSLLPRALGLLMAAREPRDLKALVDNPEFKGLLEKAAIARPAGELEALQRLVQTIAENAREDAARKDWAELERMAEKGQWQQLLQALPAFKQKHQSAGFAAEKQKEIVELQAKAEEGLDAQLGYTFDFSNAESHARFAKLFDKTNSHRIEMKFEPGKLIFRGTDPTRSGIHLQSSTIKLGAEWEISYRVKLKSTENSSYVLIRFLAPNDKPPPLDSEGYARLILGNAFLRLLAPGQRINYTGARGILEGIVDNQIPKPKADAVNDVKITMQNNHLNITLNGSGLVDCDVSKTAFDFFQNSPITLCVFLGGATDFELLRFSFKQPAKGPPAARK